MTPTPNNNIKEVTAEFKTLLSKQEYERIFKLYKDIEGDIQTNYYFDTKRFTLKASNAVLRVKRTDRGLTYILERKKGYNFVKIKEDMTENEFNELKETGKIANPVILAELTDIIKDQLVVNFMSLATFRISFQYKRGKISLDRCEYVNTVDYELEYQASNRDSGKNDFIEIIKEFNITYKKSQVKLKRAYDALRKTI